MYKKSKRSRQRIKRMILRWAVIGMIYMGMLLGAVLVFLGVVWLMKNVRYSSFVLSVLCLLAGGILFFRITKVRSVGIKNDMKTMVYQQYKAAA